MNKTGQIYCFHLDFASILLIESIHIVEKTGFESEMLGR
jgi:hypothetical protein